MIPMHGHAIWKSLAHDIVLLISGWPCYGDWLVVDILWPTRILWKGHCVHLHYWQKNPLTLGLFCVPNVAITLTVYCNTFSHQMHLSFTMESVMRYIWDLIFTFKSKYSIKLARILSSPNSDHFITLLVIPWFSVAMFNSVKLIGE